MVKCVINNVLERTWKEAVVVVVVVLRKIVVDLSRITCLWPKISFCEHKYGAGVL
jgi:hypothetical protein